MKHANQILCWDEQLQYITFAEFWQDVAQQAGILAQDNSDVMALWQTDSYDFLVLFFAVLATNKTLILPPHRVAQLEQQFKAQNIEFAERQVSSNCLSIELEQLKHAKIVFFTSGSTGEPKHIERTLQQLLNEVEGLKNSFDLPKHAVAIATVSHQHIYGLLFKLLLPLMSGGSFYREQLLYPEYVVQLQKKIVEVKKPHYLVSSPALLKRWASDVSLVECSQVFSSGGKLDTGIRPNINAPITEVLGSSETGGIAHRQADNSLWKPFSNVQVDVAEHQQLKVKSNHAQSTDWVLTGDCIDLNANGTFKLLGRIDRIVKLEEKRLSLDAIEQTILQLSEIEQCHVLIIEHEQRQMLACVAVLAEHDINKAIVVNHIKNQLGLMLEKIAIPRRWRFLSKLPINTQSKLNKKDLKALFKPMMHPVVLSQNLVDQQHIFELEFPAELECFKGHFPNQPIYPGVGQIAFVDAFARQIWSDLLWCAGYEQLKFQEVIQPHQVVELALSRKEHKVIFKITAGEKTLASGRFLFECQS